MGYVLVQVKKHEDQESVVELKTKVWPRDTGKAQVSVEARRQGKTSDPALKQCGRRDSPLLGKSQPLWSIQAFN